MPSAQTESVPDRARQRSLLWLAAEGMSDAHLLRRFVEQRDEASFEALVQRHGPMVLGVCRRQLSDPHAVDDAFQATFLVLVRKAATISQPDLLGNWLYGVAYRVSVKARANAARRSAHERQAASMSRPEPAPDVDNRELRLILDEELSRLPEKYRAPLVLCYLEGKTNEEAAKQIGCPLGSMSWRLSRGRDLLHRRLLARHLAFPAAIFLPLLTEAAASAAVPLALLDSTVRTGMVASGAQALGTIPGTVATLAEETLQTMGVAKAAKLVAIVTAVIGLIFFTSGTTAMALAWWSQRPPQPAVPCAHPNMPAPQR
jgi:RNA polymerase sigma factor (sigma-70 family)